MTQLSDPSHPLFGVEFYTTGDYPCSYLPEQLSASEVATPPQRIDSLTYSELVRRGFRRSGIFAYRPSCPNCHACIPVRIDIDRFSPNRSQKRCLQMNANLIARERPLTVFKEHYELYSRYQASRHPGGGMDKDDGEQYENFLLQSTVETHLIEFVENEQVRMVSIIDVLDDGLSSVYTFFDPDLPRLSLGTFNILWQIGRCRVNHIPYLYLGYWIEASRKMAYKSRFRPLEGLINGHWQMMSERQNDFTP